MDIKTSVKQRRQARIKELLEKETSNQNDMLETRFPEINHTTVRDIKPAQRLPEPDARAIQPEEEPDPEKLWKQGYRSWYDTSSDVPPLPPKSSFVGGMIRRLVASMLLFGAIWGIFSVQDPWAVRAQIFIMEGLSREMDFHAVQAWYEEHFGGAPSFIPIFDQRDQGITKVNGSVSLIAPIKGRIVQSFAVDLKGITLMPEEDSLSSREVKSIDTGRILEVKELPDSTLSILIQHTGERKAKYSGLSASTLKVNDWVQAGDIIGTLPMASLNEEQPTLYFMLQEGNRVIDPVDVISF